ncbi:hypothetical protein OIDMADRAFT_177952 [Oidiodendron maius Zn]|uniref:Bacteriophage T5 Orf172 DNA-binding domain-containing protein n=1 Tax=Oidiodendron maius (strain Zn) TaxID=913774 RepID=A0A0C3H6P8_OIDMZ|nr:hypothetical protein OIDMADRAFT_177952 [Oidiodendron maius Zn]
MNKEACSHNLERLAPLLLCVKSHRRGAAETIRQYWDSEIDEHLQTGKLTRQTHDLDNELRPDPSVQPATTQLGDTMKKLQSPSEAKLKSDKEIQPEEYHGSIQSKYEERIAIIMEELARHLDSSKTGLQLLGELGDLIGCPQKQILSKIMKPTSPNMSKASSGLGQVQNPSLPVTPRKRVVFSAREESPATPGSQSSSASSTISAVWSTPRQFDSPVSNISTPENIASAAKVSQESPQKTSDARNLASSPTPLSKRSLTWPKVPNEDDPPPSPTPPVRRTNARPTGSKNGHVETQVFKPMAKTYTHPQAVKEVKKLIERKIIPNEKEKGIVYIFRRPDCVLIKIGYTTEETIQKRMKGFKRLCGYVPIVIHQVSTEHAMKVESLVHRHLHKQRRKETLIYGACNEGKGCTVHHKEWFVVSDELAKSTVEAWVSWMNQKPYDANGCLKPVWTEHVKLYNWNWRDGMWTEWTSITIPNDIGKVVKEVLDVAIKTEDEEDSYKNEEHSEEQRAEEEHAEGKYSEEKHTIVTVAEVKLDDD